MSASRLNVLWVVTTQWRAQAFGYMGNRNADTPAHDRVAQEGINFAQAVTPHPFGPFARAALLTGVASPQNGVRDYFDPLPIDARTIAHDFNDRGYSTAFFGKWHLAPRDPNAPLVGEAHAKTLVSVDRRGGFQFWEGFEGGFQLNDPWLQGTRLESPIQVRGYQSDVVCERAGDWLVDTSGAPWFCMVSLEPPHPPYDAAPGVSGFAPGGLALPANVPRGGDVEARARRELRGYYAHIAATDRAIGRLLARIDAATTLVVLTSVHGDMHGAHGLFRKGWPHEESVRVPLLVRGPGIDARVDPSAVSLIDLSSLTLAWADGRANAATHNPPWALISMPSIVQLPDQCDRVWRGVRSPLRKLVLHADGSPWLFFDLETDPLEMENLVRSPRHAAQIDEWRQRLGA